MESFIFKRWSNKKYAVLSSFHKEICIGTLALSCSMLQIQPVLSQSDTASPSMIYDLEEVETIGENEAEIYAPQLRQLLLIGQEQLDLQSSRSIADLLDYYPGIDARTRGVKGIQSDLSIQGGSFDQSLVLLNGIDMSDPQTGHFNLDLPLGPSQIQKLEILKGPASKKYGLAAYTGAINIITTPLDSFNLDAEISYGQFNTINTTGSLNLPLGSIRTYITANHSGSDGYRDNTDYNSSSIYMHSMGGKDILKTELILGWNQKSFGANSFYTPKFPEQFEETSSWISALKFTSHLHALTVMGNINWRRHYDHFQLFRSNPAAYENYHQTDVLGTSIGTRISSFLGITSFNLKYRYEQIFSTTLGEALGEPIMVKNTDSVYYDQYKNREHVTLTAEHQFVLDKFFINAGFLLHTGIKDLISPGIYPGIDLAYSLNSKFNFFTSVNRSMRLPTFTDLFYQGPQNLGNPDLEPEKAMTYEAGTKYISKHIKAHIALFYRQGNKTIDWVWNDSIWQTRNLLNLNTFGGEANVTFYPESVSSLRFIEYFSASYSYVDVNKANSSIISNYALDNLKHKLVFDICIRLPFGIDIDGKVNWQDRNGSFLFYETASAVPYETPYDPFFLIDLNMGIKVKKVTFYINASNLLNTSYRDIGSVIMPGRWIIAGVKFR